MFCTSFFHQCLIREDGNYLILMISFFKWIMVIWMLYNHSLFALTKLFEGGNILLTGKAWDSDLPRVTQWQVHDLCRAWSPLTQLYFPTLTHTLGKRREVLVKGLPSRDSKGQTMLAVFRHSNTSFTVEMLMQHESIRPWKNNGNPFLKALLYW